MQDKITSAAKKHSFMSRCHTYSVFVWWGILFVYVIYVKVETYIMFQVGGDIYYVSSRETGVSHDSYPLHEQPGH